MQRARRSTKSDTKAQQRSETTRPQRDSKAPTNRRPTNEETTPPSRRESRGSSKRPTAAPTRAKRESRAPREVEIVEDPDHEAVTVKRPAVDAPFRVTGHLPDPDATRYSVIPTPTSSHRPRK